MKVISRSAGLFKLSQGWRARGKSLGLVPTMGALHEGHASLIRRAARENDRVVVSIFVNPLQFGPKEDFGRYPRARLEDLKLCRSLGVDAVYLPAAGEVYPRGFSTEVRVRGLSELLCGKFRSGHFSGVATVVLKLFQTVSPQKAYFGEKDFQQLIIVKRMAADLDLPVTIVGCPTIREKDGLALSSRNRYLSASQRGWARHFPQALFWGANAARGKSSPIQLAEKVSARIKKIPRVVIDYVSVVDPETLTPPRHLKGRLRLIAAIRIGKTRLIDNIPIKR